MRIGVVACGYADGYPRLAPGGNERGTPVLVDGVRTRTVGRVSMDMITVDLDGRCRAPTSAARSCCGAGPATAPCCRSTRSPRAAGTVGYELMCARAPRVPVARAVAVSRSRRRVRGRDHGRARPGRGRAERQQGVERGPSALRRRRLVAARRREGAPARPRRPAPQRRRRVVIKAQRHRSQELNRRDALARLNELVASAAEVPKTRAADAADARLEASGASKARACAPQVKSGRRQGRRVTMTGAVRRGAAPRRA